MVLPLLLSLTRAHFLRRAVAIAIGGASFVASNSHPQLVKADSVEMSRSPDFSVWDALLKAHVKPTTMRGIPVHAVDYEGMSEDPNFEAFVKSLESAPTTGLGKDAEYALWINSYNALAILTVVQNSCKKRFCGLKTYKISSIKDIGTLVSPVWNRPAGTVGGHILSLDDIENVKLRSPTDYPADPLLHACIVCASVSCPDVALTAYKPESLQADMEANMRHFLANPKKGLALDKAGQVITLSKVFQWFEGDFKKDSPSVLDALLPYMPEDEKSYVAEHKSTLKVAHFDYDWGLNGPCPGAPGKGGQC